MNNWEFAIHGTPGKSESWGITNDDSYLKSFYDQVNNSTESTKLDIDIRIVENVVCTYYNYLKLSNISNGIGRTGGYLGMSIRLADGYCSDVAGMYKLLDQLYEQVVSKTILRRNGTNAEYCFYSFKDCSLELEKIASIAKKALEQFTNDIRTFPHNFSPKHSGNILRYNVDDTGSLSFRNVLFRDAEVYVSKEYPLLSVKMEILDNDNKVKSAQIKEQHGIINRQNGEISSLNTVVDNQNGTIQSQNSTINNQNEKIGEKDEQIILLNKQLIGAQNTIKELTTDIKNLQKKLKDAISDKDSTKISDCIALLTAILNSKKEGVKLINTIKVEQVQKLKELDSLTKQLSDIQKAYNKVTDSPKEESDEDSDNEGESQIIVGFNWKYIASILGVFCILLLGGLFMEDDETKTEFYLDNELAKELVQFKEEVNIKFRQIDSNIEELTFVPQTGTGIGATQQDIKITWINLKGYSNVRVGNEYILEAQANGKTIDCGGMFECSNNVTIMENSGKQCKIRVNSPGSDSKVIVRYVINGQSIKNREIAIIQ